ncbi:MAG: N-6 DNA methylase [Defluviitaleaceae bacterium]|nr:N-6 DNA methylase [Defluviitaleaceae bacterium]
MNTMPLEADTRVLIDKSLENLGWVLDVKSKERNVFFEQPKTERERKLLGGKRPDYVLYSKDERGEDKAIIVIEAKRKGERVDKALEQGIHYAKQLDAPIVFATDGLFCKSYHTKFDKTPILNGEEVDEFLRETLAIKYLSNWEVNTISPKVQYDRRELIKIFDEANNMLRGDGLRAGIERFGEFANILFLKLVSENSQILYESGKNPNFDSACRWDSIKNIPSSARIDYINNTVFTRLNNLYKTIIFTPLTMRSDDILKDIMDKLDPLTLTDVDSDVKGDAFEYFLRESAATKNDLGEYFTPRHIVKTMVKLVNPQIGERVYDPFCGTGGFLIESFRHIWNTMARNDKNKETLREDTVFGNEITNTARITKMNMILTGDGHSNIHMKDSLANPVDGVKGEGYDIVLTNMPYSQKSKHGNLYDMPSNNGDSICVQHCMKAIDSTAENGRMALVVPEGFLFRKDLSKTRELLLKNCDLQSIISLPQGVFLPYTVVKTNILYATKVNQNIKPSQKRKDFWYFDVKSDGYSLDNHRRKLRSGSDLDKYLEYRKLDDDQQQEMIDNGFGAVPLDKVRGNAYIMVGGRYREQKAYTSAYSTKSIGEVCTIISGYAFPTALQSAINGNVPFYKVSDMNTTSNLMFMYSSNNYVSEEVISERRWKVAPEGTVIFPKIGAAIATNKKRILTQPSLFDNNVMGLVCGEYLLPKYMYYILTGLDISIWASLSNPPSISKDIVEECKVPVPSLEVQQQIVDELDGYQRIITHAKGILNAYNPIIPNNTIGEIMRLGDIATFRPSKGEIKALADDTIVSFVPMADLNTHDIDFIAKEDKNIADVYTGYTYFKDGDVLLAKITPCFENGKSGIARNLTNGIGFGSTEYIVIRAKPEIVYPEWIYYHINSQNFLQQGKGAMTGTAGQQRVDLNFVKNYPIVVPTLETQRQLIDGIKAEKTLVSSSKQLIDVFTKKMQNRINEIWGE